MLKKVEYLDYSARYSYSVPSAEGVINTEEIVSALLIPKENTRNVFQDITRVWFKDGSYLDIVGRPEELIKDG